MTDKYEPLTPEAVDEIAADFEVDGEVHSVAGSLIADWRAMRAALEPFAAWTTALSWDEKLPDDAPVTRPRKAGHFRAARRAFGK